MTTLKQKFQDYNLEHKHQEFVLLMIKEWLREKQDATPHGYKRHQFEKPYESQKRFIRNAFIKELLEELEK